MKVDNGSLFDDLMLIQDFARQMCKKEVGIWMGNMDETSVDSTMDDCVEIRQWMDGKKIQKRHKQYCCCLLKSCQCPPLQKYYQTNDLLSPQFCTDFPGKSRSMCNIMAAASPNIRLSINTFNVSCPPRRMMTVFVVFFAPMMLE